MFFFFSFFFLSLVRSLSLCLLRRVPWLAPGYWTILIKQIVSIIIIKESECVEQEVRVCVWLCARAWPAHARACVCTCRRQRVWQRYRLETLGCRVFIYSRSFLTFSYTLLAYLGGCENPSTPARADRSARRLWTCLRSDHNLLVGGCEYSCGFSITTS